MTVTVHHGDCLDILRTLPDASVDSVVTDPPYGLEFMGKGWDAPWRESDVNADAGMSATGYTDGGNRLERPSFTGSTNPKCRTCKGTRRGRRDGTAKVAVCLCPDGGRFPNVRAIEMRAFQQWCALWAAECLRVLKPGGHLLAFGGSRTYHRLTCAVEDSGFEIRDCITWHFGSGFPKSLNVTDALGRIVPDDARCVCGPRSTETAPDSQVGYPSSRGSDDEPPQTAAGSGLSAAPSQAGARGHSRADLPAGGAASAPASTGLDAGSGHPSTADSPHLSVPLVAASPPVVTAQSDMETSTSTAPGPVPRRTADHIQHTSGLAAGSASSSPSRNKHMACATCGGVAIPQGLGTALKPATEFIVVARKPLAGTVAQTVLAHGTGAINVDACRIEGGERPLIISKSEDSTGILGNGLNGSSHGGSTSAGRWPANVVLDGDMADVLDQQSGTLTSGANPTRRGVDGDRTTYGDFAGQEDANPQRGIDKGGASRFFYVAKADASERVRVNGTAHPTVKPLALMRWLVRLVTPPGGTVLEPFAGSGTTVEACILEGFSCIAIEREAEYLSLIQQRIDRRRDPVAAVRATGDDGGLFDLLDVERAELPTDTRAGEASAERRYTKEGGTNFAMKPGRRYRDGGAA
jgi:DNA modification methylase